MSELYTIVDLGEGKVRPSVYVDRDLPHREAQELLDDLLKYHGEATRRRYVLRPTSEARGAAVNSSKGKVGRPRR